MKSFLRRVWNEIWLSETLDAYLLILIALGVELINLLGIIPVESMNAWIASILLSVLELLAVVSLGNRHSIEGVSKTI